MLFQIEFPSTKHKPMCLPAGAKLAEYLSVTNSPMLFGCRTGICGTCLVQVEAGLETLSPADKNEKEALDIYAPGNARARLACQIFLDSNIAIKKIDSI